MENFNENTIINTKIGKFIFNNNDHTVTIDQTFRTITYYFENDIKGYNDYKNEVKTIAK